MIPRRPTRNPAADSGKARAGQGTGRGPLRIRAVTEITGVPEPTLRAWERRYGVPSPDRTASGYRLYGERALQQVRDIQRLCEQGMAAAQAAELVRSQHARATADGVDAPRDAYAAAQAAMADAVDRFDDAGLDAELRRSMFLGPSSDVLDRVFTPLLRGIGDRWHAGALSVAQEHFATQRLGGAIRDLLRLALTEGQPPAIFACFADEQHELGLLSIAVRFAGWGVRPVLLGANVPPDAVRTAVTGFSARLVALSVTVAPSPSRARKLLGEYSAACRGVPWIVGGAASPVMAREIAARGAVLASSETSALRALVASLLASRAAASTSSAKPPTRRGIRKI